MPVSEEEYCWYKNLINSVFIQSTCRNEALLAPSAFAALRSLPWHHGDFISLPSPTRHLGIRKVANHGRHPMPRAPALSSKNRPPSLDLVCYLHWPLPPSPHHSLFLPYLLLLLWSPSLLVSNSSLPDLFLKVKGSPKLPLLYNISPSYQIWRLMSAPWGPAKVCSPWSILLFYQKRFPLTSGPTLPSRKDGGLRGGRAGGGRKSRFKNKMKSFLGAWKLRLWSAMWIKIIHWVKVSRGFRKVSYFISHSQCTLNGSITTRTQWKKRGWKTPTL